MNKVLKSGENDFYFPCGLSLNMDARVLYDADALVARASVDPAASRMQYARLLSDAFNKRVSDDAKATETIRSGELLALMLLHEAYRHLLALYTRISFPGILGQGLSHVCTTLGSKKADEVLASFVAYYPPRPVLENTVSARQFLDGTSNDHSHTDYALWEIFILRVAHENPALKRFLPLYDDTALQAKTPLYRFVGEFESWLNTQPPSPHTQQTLFETLREPIRRCPDSLEGQLEYLINRWRHLLPADIVERWFIARGVMQEETFFRGWGPGPVSAYSFSEADYAEPEAFSRDEDWMPNVVLLAKLAYVWLDQLSKKYGRHLAFLSDIPDAELDQLAHWGINALWLIGVWERSSASQEIKRRMGNAEAAASAYSLYDYSISEDLGGEAALQDLAHRAGLRGIRLAGDMVPNHMGIYSKWMIEHPERFLQLEQPPFPAYHFDGPDLSQDDRVGLFIEDGYWTHKDAAVVFRRMDRRSGKNAYIYHGNDGTSMPWNDTAQLNFMLHDTREAVIQTILQVARRFPIIRFDAAMTLAKRHYQRLWFPKPGDAGAIPSRAAFGMDRIEFDRMFPNEFWREVVDRVAREAPNTLLLAEAFWLMEGYFVRTLGMHRVYNSAFMNMLKMEDNSKFRQTIKNVLEFSPEVLQRFVNFMNNPDEDTAIAQFGKGDKYFGVSVLLVTMPGLPMFGHGQIEGLTEKYGMEYRRAYRDEQPDSDLIHRHERDIFPIVRKRYLFSGAERFALFDFTTPEGWVDENVMAYANGRGEEHALIIYNNAYTTTKGVLHTSTAINEGRAEEKVLRRRSLVEALGLDTDPRAYVIWRDECTQLEYLHHCESLMKTGLHLEMHAYEFKTFFLVRQLRDLDNSWGRLHGKLAGAGVSSVQEAYLEMHLEEILDPFREFMCSDMLRHVLSYVDDGRVLGPWEDKLAAFLRGVNAFTGRKSDAAAILRHVDDDLRVLLKWMGGEIRLCLPEPVLAYLAANLPEADSPPEQLLLFWRVPIVFCLMRRLAESMSMDTEVDDQKMADKESVSLTSPIVDEPNPPGRIPAAEQTGHQWMRDWLMIKPVAEAFKALSGDEWRAWQDARLVSICLAHRADLLELDVQIWGPVLFSLFENPEMQAILMIHWYSQRRWVNKEQFERVMFMMFLVNLVSMRLESATDSDSLVTCYENVREILLTVSDTGYDINWALSALN